MIDNDRHFTTMKIFVLTLAALVAYTAAVPTKATIHADIYRNILELKTSRIIGGKEAERRQFPYQVSILWGILGSYSHVCGGTLIEKSLVLTAGHCKLSNFGSYRVALGQLKLGESHEDVQLIDVDEFIVHTGYPGGAAVAANDIALIKLKTPARLTDSVQLVSLPSEDECNKIENAILSGWGLTSVIPIPPKTLRWAELPRITNEQCANDLIKLLGNAEPLDKTMICTTANEGVKQSACSGDSGGPLVSVALNKIIGVVSWGISPCGTKGAPSVYTNVCSHLDFIKAHNK